MRNWEVLTKQPICHQEKPDRTPINVQYKALHPLNKINNSTSSKQRDQSEMSMADNIQTILSTLNQWSLSIAAIREELNDVDEWWTAWWCIGWNRWLENVYRRIWKVITDNQDFNAGNEIQQMINAGLKIIVEVIKVTENYRHRFP